MIKVELEPLWLPLDPPTDVQESSEALTTWLWTHHKEALRPALKVETDCSTQSPTKAALIPPEHSVKENDDTPIPKNTTEKKLEILDCIAEAQRMFLQLQPLTQVFQCLLEGILQFLR